MGTLQELVHTGWHLGLIVLGEECRASLIPRLETYRLVLSPGFCRDSLLVGSEKTQSYLIREKKFYEKQTLNFLLVSASLTPRDTISSSLLR